MKLLIACDMEGISGVTGWNHVLPDHPEYARGRRWMTADVNAAVRGAVEAGVDDIIVTDGHWNGSNILIEELDEPARLINGTPSPLAMVQGVQEGTDAVVFIGFHAMAGTKNAVLDHTWSSARVHNMWINGVLAGEIAFNTAVCGAFNVPVIAISGDQSACAEAAALIPGIHTAPVKKANGRMNAECLGLESAHRLITETVKQAALGYKTIKPWIAAPPMTIAIEFFRADMADYAELLPGAVRKSARVVEYTAPDMVTANRAFRAMVNLAQG